MFIWRETHYIFSVGIQYSIHPSHCDSLVFVLLLLLLTFAKHTVGISSALKMQFFPFLRSKKSQLSALVLWKLSLEGCIISRQINLLNLSKASGKATNSVGSCEYPCKGIPFGGELDHEVENLNTEGLPYSAVATGTGVLKGIYLTSCSAAPPLCWSLPCDLFRSINSPCPWGPELRDGCWEKFSCPRGAEHLPVCSVNDEHWHPGEEPISRLQSLQPQNTGLQSSLLWKQW